MTLSEKLAQIAADQGQVLSVTERDGVTCTLRRGPDPLVPALARALGVAVKALRETMDIEEGFYAEGGVAIQASETIGAVALAEITRILLPEEKL